MLLASLASLALEKHFNADGGAREGGWDVTVILPNALPGRNPRLVALYFALWFLNSDHD